MKSFYAFVFSALLAAPALAIDLSGSAVTRGAIAVGTLADANNPVEMAVAPEYTRLSVVRQRTAALLKAVANSKESDAEAIKSVLFAATQVQQFADEARRKLDGLAQAKADDFVFRTELDAVRAIIKRAETVYDAQLKGK